MSGWAKALNIILFRANEYEYYVFGSYFEVHQGTKVLIYDIMGKDCNVPSCSINSIHFHHSKHEYRWFIYVHLYDLYDLYVFIYIYHHLVIYFRRKLLPMKFFLEGASGAGSFQDGLLALCARNPGPQGLVGSFRLQEKAGVGAKWDGVTLW